MEIISGQRQSLGSTVWESDEDILGCDNDGNVGNDMTERNVNIKYEKAVRWKYIKDELGNALKGD